MTSLVDSSALAGGDGLAAADGPVGLVAGRDKVGAAGRQNIVDELGVKEEATRVRELKESAKTEHVEQGTEGALHSSLALTKLATRALEWDRWSRGELLWHLFEKYQPIFAMRFPSLRLGAAVRAVFTGVSICGMCFINALLFEYSPVGPGIPRDP